MPALTGRHNDAHRRHKKSLYGYKWQKARKAFLKRNPLCIDCLDEGRYVAATEVDHDEPHDGDLKLFWDKSNWRARCKTHHSRKTVRQDGGFGNPRR